MFSLSSTASAQIRDAVGRSDAVGLGLRVAARQEADGSLAFGMGFDELREGDLPLQIDGVEVLIAPPSQPLLEDALLDYVEVEPGQFGFVFVNQNERPPEKAGGCGSGGCSGCGG